MDIHLLERLKDIVRSAGTTVRSAQDAAMGIREKSSHVDLVTLYDPMVQEFLRSRLLTLLPEAGFLGEEDATHDIAGKRQLFIVDPIDGTISIRPVRIFSRLPFPGIPVLPTLQDVFHAVQCCIQFFAIDIIHTVFNNAADFINQAIIRETGRIFAGVR